MSNRFKVILLLFTSFFIFCFYVLYALSVDNSITTEDKQAVRSLDLDFVCTNIIGDYEKEIECLSAIQAAVQSIGETRCATSSDVIEPSEFLKRNFGCCFDRARFIEKASRYFGFETRHLFLIEPYKGFSITNFVPLGQGSHAASEIYTSKGWVGVDSNDPFILLTETGSPSTYVNATHNLDAFPMMPKTNFYMGELDFIYGLYSRHGNFHGKNFPGPEYVFKELLWNWR
jgi:hypothetical protein